MSKIIFEINYNIYPEKRDDYLSTINELRRNIRQNSNTDYSVYEDKKRPNNFTEVYYCNTQEEFDNLEDNQDDETMGLTQRLFDEYIVDKKVSYSTKYEV
jgi:quinol monooxygenase YgiN